MRSAILEISLLISLFIVLWLTTRWSPLFYIALGLIGFYVIIIILYIATKGSTMPLLDKILGLVALAGWVAIAWVIAQENGIQLWGL
jgi:hypothetical protein